MNRIIRRLFTVVVFAWTGSAVAVPITDTVTVQGLQWAQPDLFLELTWNDVNAVCPGGVCGSQSLKGYEMSGWSWATIDDMNKLFNYYIGYDALGPGPDSIYTGTFGGVNVHAASNAFYADGWRETPSDTDPFPDYAKHTMGYVSDSSTIAPVMERQSFGFGPFGVYPGDFIQTSGSHTNTPQSTGAWFYRDVPEIPIPATVWLFGSALLGLGISKRRNV